MCALLKVKAENQSLELMINCLQQSSLQLSLTESPILYRNHLQDFWRSAVYVDDVNGERIEATIQGREIEITY